MISLINVLFMFCRVILAHVWPPFAYNWDGLNNNEIVKQVIDVLVRMFPNTAFELNETSDNINKNSDNNRDAADSGKTKTKKVQESVMGWVVDYFVTRWDTDK